MYCCNDFERLWENYKVEALFLYTFGDFWEGYEVIW